MEENLPLLITTLHFKNYLKKKCQLIYMNVAYRYQLLKLDDRNNFIPRVMMEVFAQFEKHYNPRQSRFEFNNINPSCPDPGQREKFTLAQPFQDRDRYHIETSPLIFGANQWTGFYMITASVFKGLNVYFHFYYSLCCLKRFYKGNLSRRYEEV